MVSAWYDPSSSGDVTYCTDGAGSDALNRATVAALESIATAAYVRLSGRVKAATPPYTLRPVESNMRTVAPASRVPSSCTRIICTPSSLVEDEDVMAYVSPSTTKTSA